MVKIVYIRPDGFFFSKMNIPAENAGFDLNSTEMTGSVSSLCASLFQAFVFDLKCSYNPRK